MVIFLKLSGYLKNYGYYTISNGKVFDRPDDHLDAWSEPPFRFQGKVRWTDYHDPENIRLDFLHRLGRPWERLDIPDTAYFDGRIADKTIEDLKKLKNTAQPFFKWAVPPAPILQDWLLELQTAE